MILLNLGQSAQTITVTLNEKRTLDTGYYLFVFTHILTKQVVNKIYNFLDDDSSFPDRYNSFEIDTATVFTNAPNGQWIYQVYEQASSSNTDVTGLTEVERGIMQLDPVTPFAFTKYDTATNYSAYNG
jgi:predicted DNA-binding protein YlxM (UPF0122 family)